MEGDKSSRIAANRKSSGEATTGGLICEFALKRSWPERTETEHASNKKSAP
jgi:hypothetical protein